MIVIVMIATISTSAASSVKTKNTMQQKYPNLHSMAFGPADTAKNTQYFTQIVPISNFTLVNGKTYTVKHPDLSAGEKTETVEQVQDANGHIADISAIAQSNPKSASQCTIAMYQVWRNGSTDGTWIVSGGNFMLDTDMAKEK